VMRRAAQLAVAVALAAGALAARGGTAAADPLAGAARELADLEERLAAVEAAVERAAAPGPSLAARALALGEERFARGEWASAAALLTAALEGDAFAASPRRAEALYELGEALQRAGRPSAALAPFREVLATPGDPHEREASLRLLQALAALRRWREASEAFDRVRRAHGGAPPAETLYLAAKAAYHRVDLSAAERIATFRAVPPPFDGAAAYLEGALHASSRALAEAAAAFERCAARRPADARAAEVRELCVLALGRVESERGDDARALAWYAQVPPESPRFEEALYESAWADVRARRHDEALRAAGILGDVAGAALLAPRATLLRAHLALKLGRHGEAAATYARVVEGWAPLRDDLAARLATPGAALAAADAIGRGAPDGIALPAVASRWAAARPVVARAAAAVASLDAALAGVAEARAGAGRLEAAARERWGAAASAPLDDAYARAEAGETGALRLAALLATEEAKAHPAAFTVGDAYRRARGAREAAAAAVAALPATPEAVGARREAGRRRAAAASARLSALALEAAGGAEAVAAAQGWLARHAVGDAAARVEIAAELSAHAGIVAGYAREAAALRAEAVCAEDAAGEGHGGLAADALRERLRATVAREGELLASARAGLEAGARARAEAVEALRARGAEVEARADRVKRRALAVARDRSAALLADVAAERARLDEAAAELASARAEARDLAAKAVEAAVDGVRAELSRLIREADVGLIDVAWTLKRQRIESIQALSAKKARDLAAVEADAAGGGAR
jgi:hypothetical protein